MKIVMRYWPSVIVAQMTKSLINGCVMQPEREERLVFIGLRIQSNLSFLTRDNVTPALFLAVYQAD